MPKSDLDLEMVFLCKCHLRDTVKKHSPGQDAGASLSSFPPSLETIGEEVEFIAFCKKNLQVKGCERPRFGSLCNLHTCLGSMLHTKTPAWLGESASAQNSSFVNVHQTSEGK